MFVHKSSSYKIMTIYLYFFNGAKLEKLLNTLSESLKVESDELGFGRKIRDLFIIPLLLQYQELVDC